nr:restriction endonuclease [Streptomyces olivoreticuli]
MSDSSTPWLGIAVHLEKYIADSTVPHKASSPIRVLCQPNDLWILAGRGKGAVDAPLYSLRTVRSAKDAEELTPQEFERLVADLCYRDGLRLVQEHGRPGDRGADVIAERADGYRFVFDCKRYVRGSVGFEDVAKLGGTARQIHHADLPAVVTPGSFTKRALEYAIQQKIAPIGRSALDAWIRGTSLPNVLDWTSVPAGPAIF